jgi:acetyl esterase/lipase
MSERSLSYRIVEAAVGYLGPKRIFRLGAEGLRAFLEKNKARRSAAPPACVGRKCRLEKETIGGRPCSIILPRGGGAGARVVLFIHGGGFILEAHPIHWRAASRLVSRLDVPVWFPSYPLFPDHTIPDAAEMVLQVYKRMLERYRAPDITVLGDSAGAALAIIMCHHISMKEPDLPMPGKLVLLSPAMIVERDEAVRRAMRGLECRDRIFSVNFMDSIRELFNLDTAEDNYYHSFFYGDFSRFPPMHIFCGTFECIWPQLAAFITRLKASGIEPAFYPGREMMHVWPYIPLARECKEALRLIFKIIAGP